MKVLVVLSVSPYPKNIGKRIMLGGICDYLKQSSRVTSICIASFVDESTAGIDHTVLLRRPSAIRKVFNAMWHSMLRETKSLQESFFWSPVASKQLASLIRHYQPHLILYDTVRTGQYSQKGLESPSCTKLIYMDDLFSLRYEKMLVAMEEHPHSGIDALGNFASNVPGLVLSFYKHLAPLRKWLLRLERRLVAASENRAPAQFDRALLVSSAEQLVLVRRTSADNIFVLPPRLDTPGRAWRRWNGQPTFVFVGSLTLAHNTVSLELFLMANMRRLIELIPNVMISVVGRGARKELVDLAGEYPEHITLHGYVDDLDEVLSSACAMVSPLVFGSGVKLKVIDSLRCGTPLITTAVGAEGIEVAESVGVIVYENVENFPEAMAAMLDPVLNATASEANTLLYRKHYSLAAVDQVYEDVLFENNSLCAETKLSGSRNAA